MPVVKVWGIPADETEERLKKITIEIVFSIILIRELSLGTNDITVFFPSDRMADGLGEEVIIEITGLFSKTERNDEVRQKLAINVGECLKGFYTTAKVECFVYTFEPSQGFYSS